ncbi:hypothetical protein IMCC3317_39290 [Kordia antarctica]|uniref:Na(+)-translocating NADH-quinone reductase subunit F n=1 Tax=Kordia antarctica TaxID=1218801 RepID=A0A7L4ZQT7_9FLAO|nr:Na(+)-translocating NADH-quinone reductase subunit F [Kordia antarctica]QHI38536.1 hypothetical protein IMCC3317_39290 [Kordia antarctica]
MEKLTKQELHNLAMNIVGKELEEKGYEFLAVNSQLKKHPQFVCIDKLNKKKFVLVKAVTYPEDPKEYDTVWMETFRQHVEKFEGELYFAGVGLGNADNPLEEVLKDQPYILDYDGLIQIT